MEVVRLVEDAVLKTVGLHSFGGSSPSASADEHVVRQLADKAEVCKTSKCGFESRHVLHGSAPTLESWARL